MGYRSMATRSTSFACLDDVEQAAKAAVPRDIWDFIEGGSGRERSLAANSGVLDAYYLTPRVLRDVSKPATGTRLLGESVEMPMAIAPMSYQRLLHPDGEFAAAQAAKTAGIPFIVPMFSSVAVERVAETGALLWFQLYWLRDRRIMTELLKRAEEAGCRAVILTVDVPRLGRRLRDIRNGFALPAGVRAAHFSTETEQTLYRRDDGSLTLDCYLDSFDPSISWSDVEWLRAQTRLPFILKGILAPEDARAAVDAGVNSLVVSNHGGRQLDCAIPAVETLPAVRDAVGESVELLVDGGIRCGSDIVKAIALGGSGVLLGRPTLHALILNGRKGVSWSLSLLREELEDVLALAGCRHLKDAATLKVVKISE